MRKFNDKKFGINNEIRTDGFTFLNKFPTQKFRIRNPPRNFIYGPSRRSVSEEFGEMKFRSNTRFLETFEQIRTKIFVKLITIIRK